jgi:hypothetical protein
MCVKRLPRGSYEEERRMRVSTKGASSVGHDSRGQIPNAYPAPSPHPLYCVLFRHVSSPGDDRVLARASCACPISPSVLTAISSDRDVSVVVSMLPTPDVQRQHSTGLHLIGGLRIYSVNSSDDLYDATLRIRGRVRDTKIWRLGILRVSAHVLGSRLINRSLHRCLP